MIVKPEELAIHEPNKKLLKIINKKIFNDKILYESESAFHTIKIVENEIGKFLHYKDTYQAGYINTPSYKGNLPYINYFLIPYLMNPKIEKILLIGLGTGIIVNQFEKLFKNLKKIDVVDIEENILHIAQCYFNFTPTNKFNFTLQDGIVFLNNTKNKYDLIIVDVASNEGIDSRFCTEDYLQAIKKRLKKDGIFVSNMPSSADILNPKNSFTLNLINSYKKQFQNIDLYKGNMSDKIYYKSFFNIDERVIDITNLIIIASNKKYLPNQNISNIENLGIPIQKYLIDKI